MQRVLSLAIAAGALTVVLALVGTCAKAGLTRGGTDPSVVARNVVQAIIDRDDTAFMRYVNPEETRAVPALDYGILRGCEIDRVRVPMELPREPVSVTFKEPCGIGTRAIPCLGVLLEIVNRRYYFASMGGCTTREPA